MTPFFIPDCAGRAAHETYDQIRDAAERTTGHRPTERRISGLTCRRDGIDLETKVGEADPVLGETVVAILDLGRHLPYLIHCGAPEDSTGQILIKKPVYAVTEFTA
jgi:hypothetical protein